MEWTKEQCQQVLESYWDDRPTNCPECGGPLAMEFSCPCGTRLAMYHVNAYCRRCESGAVLVGNDDPKVFAKLRQWTTHEVAEMAETFFGGGEPACPVCSHDVDCAEHSGRRVMLECNRCSNSEFFDSKMETASKEG